MLKFLPYFFRKMTKFHQICNTFFKFTKFANVLSLIYQLLPKFTQFIQTCKSFVFNLPTFTEIYQNKQKHLSLIYQLFSEFAITFVSNLPNCIKYTKYFVILNTSKPDWVSLASLIPNSYKLSFLFRC
jgi:hypothetical protein